MPQAGSYQTIAAKIVELIDSGVFPSGSRLKSDKELAEHFGVSRYCIREARIALQAQGRLELKGRSGTYVSQWKKRTSHELPRVAALELTEARVLFEAEAAALAAPIITDDDLWELESYIEIMSGKTKSDMTADEADAAFHTTIARATNNHMIIFIVESMWKIRTESSELQKVYKTVCNNNSSHREDEHLEILKALKNRDSVAARKAMRAHFTSILETLIEVSEKEAYQAAKQQISKNRSRFLLASQTA